MRRQNGLWLAAVGAVAVLTAGRAAQENAEKESANKVGGGYIVYHSEHAEGHHGSGDVIFSHLAHGEKRAGFDCAACHEAAGIEKRRGAVTMAAINEGKACGHCHNGETKGPKSGEVAFAVKECSGCHMPDKDIVFEAAKGPGKVTFSHAAHTGVVEEGKVVEKAGFACGDCHPKPFARKAGEPLGMAVPHKSGGCATCHDGKQVSPSGLLAKAATANCMMCHKRG